MYIEVLFVKVEGRARHPIAHSCLSLLKMSKQGENLPFRTEFISMLNANILDMDIIRYVCSIIEYLQFSDEILLHANIDDQNTSYMDMFQVN